MRNLIYSVLAALVCAVSIHSVEAQILAPAASPRAELKQEVGLVDITIEYSRPGMKDRKIFGEMLPFGQFWRTGANAPTTITFSDDVMIGGQALKGGSYSLFSYPGEDEWTVIFSHSKALPGAEGYDKSQDAVRIQVRPETLGSPVETFTIDVANIRNNTATIDVSWENTRVSIPVSMNTDEKVFASIEKVMAGPGANDYYAAAGYYLNAGKDLEQAREWAEKAVEMTGGKFYWMTHTKAVIESELGLKEEAVKSANVSLKAAQASGDKHYVMLNEKLISELK